MPESTKDIINRLKRQEDVTHPGANIMTPKQHMLDASEVQNAHPDRRIRWVNLQDPQKVASRKAEGYEIIPKEEGGRRLGDDLVLMSLDREVYEARVKRIERLNKDRMHMHEREMEQIAESVAKILRDKHGLDISTERILVKE